MVDGLKFKKAGHLKMGGVLVGESLLYSNKVFNCQNKKKLLRVCLVIVSKNGF